MAANSFIDYVRNIKKDNDSINVENFFKSYCLNSTPIKMKMKYHDNVQDSIKEARNCIISNLNLNIYFQKKAYKLSRIEEICRVLSESQENANDDQQAQIIFLLHLSKAKFDFNEIKYFEYFFGLIRSIQMKTKEFQYKDEYDVLFNSLKNNKIIKKIVCDIVYDISRKKVNYDFNLCNIEYFESKIAGLNGFAGFNKIYISKSEQFNLYEFSGFSSTKYTEAEKFVILKCNFTRTLLHEMTHVILRKTLNDFNMSSPKTYEATSQLSTTITNETAIEAGILAEKRLFNERIDWKMSAKSEHLNLAYCSSFIEKLFVEQDDTFDFRLAGVVLNDSAILIMGVDINIGIEPFICWE